MFSDELYDSVSTAYADLMVQWFPEYKEDYKTFKARAKNVLMFIFKENCIVPNKKVAEWIQKLEPNSSELNMLKDIFGDKVIEDIEYFNNLKNGKS